MNTAPKLKRYLQMNPSKRYSKKFNVDRLILIVILLITSLCLYKNFSFTLQKKSGHGTDKIACIRIRYDPPKVQYPLHTELARSKKIKPWIPPKPPGVICIKLYPEKPRKKIHPVPLQLLPTKVTVGDSNLRMNITVTTPTVDYYEQYMKVPVDKETSKQVEDDPDNVIETHPLENVCKYGILHPYDKSVIGWTKKVGNRTCAHVLPDIVTFQESYLTVDQDEALNQLGHIVVCKYRPFAGCLFPDMLHTKPMGPWATVMNISSKIYDDQIEVICNEDFSFISNDKFDYKYAFAHVPRRLNKTFTKNTEQLLSISIILFDSTSRNAFRRHMPITWDYMVNELDAFDLEGYMKVADNTVPNLLPLFTGLRYGNQDKDMPSDFLLNETMVVEKVPFIWKEYQDKGCVTMFNDDPVYPWSGLFNYPLPEFNGMKEKPMDYWFRPWQVYYRSNPIKNSSLFCFGNEFYFDQQLDLHEQMTNRYSDTCHFSFTMFSDISHDETSFIELMDEKFKQFIIRLYSNNAINNSVLIVMGDHGQRVGNIRHSIVGRFEERMPLLLVLLPEWFQKKYPKLIRNFRLNKHRLTTHFDMYQTLKDFSDGNFDGTKVNEKFPRKDKGISLLHNVISKNRTCRQAYVPENHCACLIPDKPVAPNDTVNTMALELIRNYTINKLISYTECEQLTDIKISNITSLTLSQMVQHGVRNLNRESLAVLKRHIEGHVNYFEVEYTMLPMNITALIRLENDIENKLFFINTDPPLILNGVFGCSRGKTNLLPFCKCLRKLMIQK